MNLAWVVEAYGYQALEFFPLVIQTGRKRSWFFGGWTRQPGLFW